jgi:hypothetical protein
MSASVYTKGWMNKRQFVNTFKLKASERQVIHGWMFSYYHPFKRTLTTVVCSEKPEYATSKQVTYLSTLN